MVRRTLKSNPIQPADEVGVLTCQRADSSGNRAEKPEMICSRPPQLTWRTVSAEGCASPGERWPLSAHAATRPNGAHEYPSGPVAKHPKLGDLNSRHLFSYRPRGWKSDDRIDSFGGDLFQPLLH